MATATSIVRRHEIDLIWATAPPLSDPWLARRIKKRTGVPYVADFRDIYLHAGGSDVSRRDRRYAALERTVLRDAAGFIYVSPPQAAVAYQKHPFTSTMPRRLVYNGFEPSDATGTARVFDRPTILHGGSLYGGTRRLDGLMGALAYLAKSQPPGGNRIQFAHFGSARDGARLADTAAAHDVSDAVRIEGSVSRAEFLSACRGADILLVAVGHDTGLKQHAGAIPGKLFDYFAAGRPILVLGPEDCEAARLVEQLNRGLGAPDDEPQQIADTIIRLIHGNGRSGKLNVTAEAVQAFASPAQVKQMAEFFDEIMTSAPIA
jgi:glycosyltransferase involved in cell wall biosynthesis